MQVTEMQLRTMTTTSKRYHCPLACCRRLGWDGPHLANQLHNPQLLGSRVEAVSSHQRLFYQLCCYATPTADTIHYCYDGARNIH